jgi:hypothetical protein
MLHTLIGYFITFVTIVWGFKALAYGQWDASDPNPHVVLGLIVLSTIFIVSITGIVSALIGRFYHGTKPWSSSKEPQNRVGKFHKIAGYFIILCGIAANASGIVVF